MQRYFIKITYKDKTQEIIQKVTTLEKYKDDFKLILNNTNIDHENTTHIYSEQSVKIFNNTKKKNKGYIYNTISNVSTFLYELSLIKINSSFFKNSTTDIQTQTQNEIETDIPLLELCNSDNEYNSDNSGDSCDSGDSVFIPRPRTENNVFFSNKEKIPIINWNQPVQKFNFSLMKELTLQLTKTNYGLVNKTI